MSGLPFHRCTHTALSPKGDIYVADGYGNARIHKYAPDGRLIKSWGESGTMPGQFNIAHNITCDPDGWVYVADRENHRMQVFDGEGRFEAQWNNLHRPCAMHMPYCSCPICYLVEMGAPMTINRDFKNIGPRLSILDNKGEVLARIGTQIGLTPDSFIAPHGVAVDSTGSVYVAEVTVSTWPVLFPDKPVPKDICTLRKLVKVS
jgi:DNA-binding beta-propeller fold protein YncE